MIRFQHDFVLLLLLLLLFIIHYLSFIIMNTLCHRDDYVPIWQSLSDNCRIPSLGGSMQVAIQSHLMSSMRSMTERILVEAGHPVATNGYKCIQLSSNDF